MKNILIISFVLLFLGCSTHVDSKSKVVHDKNIGVRFDKDVENIRLQCVKVSTLTGSGSGIVIGKKDGEVYILTASHVVKDSKVIFITKRGTLAIASIVASCPKRDVAIIKIKGDYNNIAKFNKDEIYPSATEEIFISSNPLGIEDCISKGNISTYVYINGYYHICTTASATFGSSGGGVFDKDFKLIGMLVRKLDSNMNFSVSSFEIKKFLIENNLEFLINY